MSASSDLPWYVPYEEGAGSNRVTDWIGPFASEAEANSETARLIDRFPYWEPTGDPEQHETKPAKSSSEQ